MNYDTAAAVACLTSVFLEVLEHDFPTLKSFEDEVIDVGHGVMAKAMAAALELFDEGLCSGYAPGVRIKEKRYRHLASRIGDIGFARRVCTDTYGNPLVPLDEVLDLAHGARISPGAAEFLVSAGIEVSYAKAAYLLELSGGSSVSARSVMNLLRKSGSKCEEDDLACAHELYVNGVVPDADKTAEEICLEADGTYIPLQDGGSAEIKACVAYAGKTAGKRAERISAVRHGCVGKPGEFWPQAISIVGQRFNLSKVKTCHAGFDGEAWCKQAGGYLPGAIKTDGNLDAFHVNRAVAACFPRGEKDARYQVLDCVWYGRAEDAAEMLEYYKEEGATKGGDIVAQVSKYLRNNASFIRANPPSLGTMEAENEHLYASRMKSVPCAWSVQGASDMARLRSRKFSGREMLYPTREESLSDGKRKLRQKRVDKHFDTRYPHPVKYVGHGYEYPHKASTTGFRADIRYHAGLTADHKVREV